jgi:hypothetical protein
MAHQPLDPGRAPVQGDDGRLAENEFGLLLEQELSIEPSRDFLPSLRERIHSERAHARRLRSWIAIPFAAAATLAVAFSLSTSSIAPSTPVPPPAPPLSSRARAPSLREYRVPNTEYRVPSTEYRIPNTEYRTAEVIVDPRQRAALLAFIDMVNGAKITAAAFATTTVAPAEIEEQVSTIAVEEVAVSPIVAGGVLPAETVK